MVFYLFNALRPACATYFNVRALVLSRVECLFLYDNPILIRAL